MDPTDKTMAHVLAQIEARSQEATDRVRAMLHDEGRPELAAQLDRRLRNIETGVYAAQQKWRGLSKAQQTAMLCLLRGDVQTAGLGTWRALKARGLAELGTQPMPSRGEKARPVWMLTERGRFVLAKGRR